MAAQAMTRCDVTVLHARRKNPSQRSNCPVSPPPRRDSKLAVIDSG
jgi:hypothetical protein